MEKINSYYKRRTWKIEAKLSRHADRSVIDRQNTFHVEAKSEEEA